MCFQNKYFNSIVNHLRNGTPEEFYQRIFFLCDGKFSPNRFPCIKDNINRCVEFIVDNKEYFDRLSKTDNSLDAIIFIILYTSGYTRQRIVDVEKFVPVAIEKFSQYFDYFTNNIDVTVVDPFTNAIRKTVEFFVEIIQGK